MDVNTDNISLVPKFQFSTTLEQQECELITNPLLQRMKQVRKSLENDPYRPIYHYVNPEGRLNDPNGLCFWQGNWHLFYQAYPPEDPRQHWGHGAFSTPITDRSAWYYPSACGHGDFHGRHADL